MVNRKELAAALLFASSDGTRFALNGVHFELRPNQQPLLVTLDGRRLSVIETTASQIDGSTNEPYVCGTHSFILRADFAKAFVQLSRACSKTLLPWIEIEQELGSKRIIASMFGSGAILEIENGAIIEGTYPEWRKVVPPRSAERKPVTEIGLNPEFVADYAKAAKLMESESLAVQFQMAGPDSAIEVRIPTLLNFYSVVMPMKLQETDYQPGFLNLGV